MSPSTPALFTLFLLVLVMSSESDGASVLTSTITIPSPDDLEVLTSSKILLDHTSSTPSAQFNLAQSGRQRVQAEEDEEVISSSAKSSSKYGQILLSEVRSSSSPLHVARCRATCLEKFQRETSATQAPSQLVTSIAAEERSTSADDLHLLPILRLRKKRSSSPHSWKCQVDSVDCSSCWKSCELLETGKKIGATAEEQGEVNEAFTTTKLATEEEEESTRKDGENKQSIFSCSQLDSTQCGSGCQVACSFFHQLAKSGEIDGGKETGKKETPVVATKQGSGVQLLPGKITWPPVEPPLSSSTPVVYVAIQEYPDRKWRQIAQTTKTEIEIPVELTSAMKAKLRAVRILAVGPQGLLSVYSPERGDDELDNGTVKVAPARNETAAKGNGRVIASASSSTGAKEVGENEGAASVISSSGSSDVPDKSLVTTYSPESPSTTSTQPSGELEEAFQLRRVSLIHQKSLVIAELRWNGMGSNPSQEYLITWELTGGGLKGHLVTDSTSVTLSLWPDTLYRIQVELFEQNLDSDGEQPAESSSQSLRSAPLTVDTGEASFPMGSSSALLSRDDDTGTSSNVEESGGGEEEDYSEHEDDEEDDFEQEESETEMEEESAHKSHGFLNMTLVLGISVSALIFVLVILTLAAFTWTRMRQFSFSSSSPLNGSPATSPTKESSGLRGEKENCCYKGLFSSYSSASDPQLLLSQEELWEDPGCGSSFASPLYFAVELDKCGGGDGGGKHHSEYSIGTSPHDEGRDFGMPTTVAVISSNSSLAEAAPCSHFNYFYEGCHHNSGGMLFAEELSSRGASRRMSEEQQHTGSSVPFTRLSS